MLLNNFLYIQSVSVAEPFGSQQQCLYSGVLSENHMIYKGHFPGNPIVPGVCQVQMIKELVELTVKHPLNLTESDNIKFLSMINPRINSHLEFNIHIIRTTDCQFSVTANIKSGATTFLKFKGKFEFIG